MFDQLGRPKTKAELDVLIRRVRIAGEIWRYAMFAWCAYWGIRAYRHDQPWLVAFYLLIVSLHFTVWHALLKIDRRMKDA